MVSSRPSPPGWPGRASSSSSAAHPRPRPHAHPHRNQSHAADLVDGAVPRHCPSTSLCMCAVVHGDPILDWSGSTHSTPLPPRPPCPLSPRDTLKTATAALGPCWNDGQHCSIAALQHQMDLCVRPSGHLTSPARRRVLSGPTTPTGPPRFYLSRGSTLLQYLAQGPVDAAARGKPHLTVFMHVCHDRHATLPCPALSCPTLRPGSARLFKRAWAQLDLSVLGRPGLVDVSFLPACRGGAALLSASSAVDSSEDTSPSLHIAGHRDPLFCHRCRLVQSDFVNGYLLQSPPNCVTSNPKYRYQLPPGGPARTRHCSRYGYTVIIVCVPVLHLSTLPLPHWKLVIPVPWHQNGPCQLVRTLAFHVFQTHAPIVKLQSR